MDKNLPANAENRVWNLPWCWKVPHAPEQLRTGATTVEPVHGQLELHKRSQHSEKPDHPTKSSLCSRQTRESPRAASKTHVAGKESR